MSVSSVIENLLGEFSFVSKSSKISGKSVEAGTDFGAFELSNQVI